MGLPVQLIDSDGKVLADSRISFISPQVDNTTQTVLVKARIANGNEALRQSQFIRARVVWGTHPSPAGADPGGITTRGTVFCVRSGAAEWRGLCGAAEALKIGQTVGNDYEVQEGIKPGDKVIVSGTQFLEDGAPVTPMG